MPKVKTNSGAKKRFTFTGTGKIKRKHAYKSHILTKKTKKQKRNLTKVSIVDKANLNSIRELLVKKELAISKFLFFSFNQQEIFFIFINRMFSSKE